MTDTQEAVIAKIEEQRRKVPEHSGPWMIAPQLMDICRGLDPASADLLLKDLNNPEMDITHAEWKIREYADSLSKALNVRCVAVSYPEAEKILREFYGLPEAGAVPDLPDTPAPPDGKISLNLLDFLGG